MNTISLNRKNVLSIRRTCVGWQQENVCIALKAKKWCRQPFFTFFFFQILFDTYQKIGFLFLSIFSRITLQYNCSSHKGKQPQIMCSDELYLLSSVCIDRACNSSYHKPSSLFIFRINHKNDARGMIFRQHVHPNS